MTSDEDPFEHWAMAQTAPEAALHPASLPGGLAWHEAAIPGTAAQVLRGAGLWDGEAELALNRFDHWYRARARIPGPHRLHFAGLATLAELFLDGEPILASTNMFRPAVVDAVLRPGAMLHIRFRSLFKALEGQRGRPRWRPRMATPPSLRAARTTLLGHMPGWCPVVQAVGPYRPITSLALDGTPRLEGVVLRPVLQGDGSGRLDVRLGFTGSGLAGQDAELECGGVRQALRWESPAILQGAAILPGVQPWWPHTHGVPHRHPVTLRIGDRQWDLGAVGFRRIECDRGADGRGFALRVNDVPVFCRGANWITPDLAGLPGDAAACRPILEQCRDAGLNMLRLPGVGLYESDAFYDSCDALGILVWQDAMFANFDYRQDDAFLQDAQAEIAAFLDRTSARACLAVFCGGSEIAQQAAMLGVPAADRAHPLFDRVIPETLRQHRPDLVFVPHSPDGDGQPFLPGNGVSHYYGVGAYQRPLDDARRAGVRFATECLALANVPEDAAIARAPRVWHTHDPRWKAGVPRDAGTGWDFEDVRDHYLATLFGVEPARLRYEEPERYLDLSRAVSAHLIEQVFAEWRRPGSGCGGGLVWLLQDLRPGAGWGVIDHRGAPKPAWYGLRRAARPVQIAITDEGLNGLGLHLLNETDAAHDVVVQLACLADGAGRVAGAERRLALPARSGLTLSSADLLPGFFDITYAYRFGPPAHDVSCASLLDAESGALLAEAFHFPRGLARPRAEIGLRAELRQDDAGWFLGLRTDALAQFVHVADARFRPDQSWFHMAPGRDYRIALAGAPEAMPGGSIAALNTAQIVRYGDP